MKRKIYFIILSIVEIVASVYSIIFSNKVLESQLNDVNKVLENVSDESKELFESLINKVGNLSIIMSAVICIVLALLILNIAIKGDFKKDRSKLIWLTIISFFLVINDIVGLLIMVGFIISLCIEKDNVVKEKRDIPNLSKHSTSLRDILLGIGFVLLYFSDHIWSDYVPKSMGFIAIFAFEIILIICALLLYRSDLKRDFNELKSNFKIYFKYALKKWGLMLLSLIVVGTIISIIFGDVSESVNQSMLKKLPLLYVIPSAVIMAPIVEEMIFRGVLRKIIRNDKLFIVLSALLFGLLHVTHEASILSALKSSITYILMGGFLAHTYVKTNNITINMMVHSFQNILGSIGLLFF